MGVRQSLAILSAVALLAGCATSGGGQSTSAPEPVIVHVTADEFSISSDRTSFEVGTPYEFQVVNNGKIAHEVMLMPVMSGEGMSMDDMDEVALGIAEEEELVPGATVTFDVTFDASAVGKSLELACHLPSHYEANMRLPITVTGA